MAKALAQILTQTIARESPRLRALSERDSDLRTGGSGGWSKKLELGHLLDSAANNRVRFIVATLEGRFTGPTYDGNGWVEIGGYDQTRWLDLVELWERTNTALAVAVANIPEEKLSASVTTGSLEPATLEFLINDYILHMQHHLAHILGPQA